MITSVAVLAACGKNAPAAGSDNGEDPNIDSGDAQTAAIDNTASDSPDLLKIRFNGHSYDLDAPFSQIVADAQDHGDVIADARTARLINEDGSNSDIKVAGNTEIDRSSVIPAEIKILDGGFWATSFYFEENSLPPFVSADNISMKTSVKKLPDYYIPLGDENTPFDKSYVVVLKNSTPWDIQSYIDQLPESMSLEFMEEVNNTLTALKPVSQFRPLVFTLPWKETFEEYYNNGTEFKNNAAVIQAIEAAYRSVLNGEIDNMGLFYIYCREGKINKCYYHIFRNTSADADTGSADS